MNNISKQKLQNLITPLLKQGPEHKKNLVEIFETVRKVLTLEFTEDSDTTLDAFMYECFNDVVPTPFTGNDRTCQVVPDDDGEPPIEGYYALLDSAEDAYSMNSVELDFMVVPKQLAEHAFVTDAVRIHITNCAEMAELGLLGESGIKLARAGLDFYFTRELAYTLIRRGIAEIV